MTDVLEMETRPKWTFSEITEHDFRKIKEFGPIHKVESKFRWTSADDGYNYLEVYTEVGDKIKSMVLPQTWKHAIRFDGDAYGELGLFQYTYDGERMLALLEKIDKWETNNKRERTLYEKLKKKFEG